MHEHGLIKRALKKHQKKMNITKYRKKLKALRDWQIDVKDLIDIPNIFALIKLGILPRYQYSAKDVVTGVSFFWDFSFAFFTERSISADGTIKKSLTASYTSCFSVFNIVVMANFKLITHFKPLCLVFKKLVSILNVIFSRFCFP
jgi:hypothetical protein